MEDEEDDKWKGETEIVLICKSDLNSCVLVWWEKKELIKSIKSTELFILLM